MTMEPDPLASVITAAATVLPESQTLAMAEGFDPFDEPTSKARRKVYGIVPTGAFRYRAGEVFEHWKSSSVPVTGASIALALRSAAETAGRLRSEQDVSVVWTGPDTSAVPIRQTREVLIDVIRSAKESLYIVSFAAYKVQDIVGEIAAACDRGVLVRLVLETSKEDGGNVGLDPAIAFDDILDQVEIFRWDPSKRPEGASMHVKAAIADGHTAFVTSANFTGSAVKINMELGILVEGGDVPHRLSEHFGVMTRDGILTPVSN